MPGVRPRLFHFAFVILHFSFPRIPNRPSWTVGPKWKSLLANAMLFRYFLPRRDTGFDITAEASAGREHRPGGESTVLPVLSHDRSSNAGADSASRAGHPGMQSPERA